MATPARELAPAAPEAPAPEVWDVDNQRLAVDPLWLIPTGEGASPLFNVICPNTRQTNDTVPR